MHLDPRLAQALDALVTAMDDADASPDDAAARRRADEQSAIVALVARSALDDDGLEGAVLQTLMVLERSHLQPTPNSNAASVLAADFTEIGASGRRIDRTAAIELLAARAADGLSAGQMIDPAVRALCTDVWALSYDLLADGHRTRRTSIWRRWGAAWELTMHQCTPVTEM